ncbi:MMPL family transporter [Nocardia wallacei]|uniref:MMPL family transporter n=1 Tax=Nocardia wallacei TaxID=480035 RepID=UPI00245515B3|nr:MMPL family transporter [Nocardia wallacei]
MTQSATTERAHPPRPAPPLRLAGRWGVLMARHRKIVLGVWLLLAVLCGSAYPALHDKLGAPDYGVPGSESSAVDSLVSQHFTQFGVEQDLLVFHSEQYPADAPEFRAVIDRALRSARAVDGVTGVVSPFEGNAALQISADRHTALGIVGIEGGMSERVAVATDVQSAVAAASNAAVEVTSTGYAPVEAEMMRTETADMSRAEAIGVPVAAAFLVLALGAVVAATVPIAVTAAGIAVAVGVLFGLTAFLTFDSLVLSVATMIATGTAIDYAMFIVSRCTEELARRGVRDRRRRADIEQSVGAAMDTAGRTVLASGLIVMISLCSLAVVGLSMLDGIAVGVVTAVIATLTAAFTLLPALLATLGPAVNRGGLPPRLRPAQTRTTAASSAWTRWAHTVMARPIRFALAGVALLLVAAAPLTGIRYGIDMGLGALTGTPTGRGNELVRDNFGPGLLAPTQVLATGPGDTPLTPEARAEVARFLGGLSGDPRVATVLSQPASGRVLASVVAKDAFDSTRVSDLIADIRSRATSLEAAEVRVGGTSATFSDVSRLITARLPWVVALVLAASLAFLIVAFRSIVLAIKAILLNLLATGAALGLTVAVFQHGIGESALGFHSTGFLQVYLPMLVFAVLFGLSMDYEVFLVRRMKEAWDRHGDNTAAVAEGLQHTARPITAAAAIMVAVFASFVTADVLELKQIGFALAVAIAIDALLVRFVLVPAFMRLFGRWNWWLPLSRGKTPRAQPNSDSIASTADPISST